MVRFKYKMWNVVLTAVHYGSSKKGNVALTADDADDHSPVAVFTKNFPFELEQDEVAIDVNNCGPEIVQLLIANNVISPVKVKNIGSGYVLYPVYKLHPEFLN